MRARGSGVEQRDRRLRASRSRRACWWLLLLGAGGVRDVALVRGSPAHASHHPRGGSNREDRCGTVRDVSPGRAGTRADPELPRRLRVLPRPGERPLESQDPKDIRFPANHDCEACHDTGHRTLLGWTMSEHIERRLLHGLPRPSRARALARAPARGSGPGDRPARRRRDEPVQRLPPGRGGALLDLPSHHPLREGMIDCTDCHDPHGSGRASRSAWRRSSARAATRITRVPGSTSIRLRYRGLRVLPRASRHELARPARDQRARRVCISCHTVAEAGAVHDPFAFVTRCSDCHSAVHGSYADPHLRR